MPADVTRQPQTCLKDIFFKSDFLQDPKVTAYLKLIEPSFNVSYSDCAFSSYGNTEFEDFKSWQDQFIETTQNAVSQRSTRMVWMNDKEALLNRFSMPGSETLA